MSGLEWNKIAASVFLAGLIAMVAGKFADILYVPITHPETKGYAVEVSETNQGNAQSDQPEEEVDINALLADADVVRGERIFRRCSTCHTTEKDGANKVGPNLWEIINAKKAHIPGFSYSRGLVEMEGTWTVENLYKFIENPRRYLPGTRMSFPGIRDPQQIADVIGYLNTMSDKPIDFK